MFFERYEIRDPITNKPRRLSRLDGSMSVSPTSSPPTHIHYTIETSSPPQKKKKKSQVRKVEKVKIIGHRKNEKTLFIKLKLSF